MIRTSIQRAGSLALRTAWLAAIIGAGAACAESPPESDSPPEPEAETAAPPRAEQTTAGASNGQAAAPADPETEARLKALEERIRQLTEELKALKEGQKPEAVGKVVDEKLKQQKPQVGYDQGFFIQSADGNNRLRLRGHLQTYFRGATTPNGRTNVDSIFVRRARPIIEATLQKHIDFRIMTDFGGGATTLFDAYTQLNYLPSAQIRIGKFKQPLSLERIQAAPDLTFIERSIANNLAPNRDVGIQIGGPILKNRAEYQIAFFNGTQDLVNVDGDAGNDKDLVARLFLTPFHNQEKSPLKELGFGFASTFGSRDEAATAMNYRTAARSSFFRLGAGTTGDGRYLRLAPQMYYYHGPFGFQAEYLTSRQELINGAAKGTVQNRGWFAQAHWVLTGEKAGFRQLAPKRPFDPKRGHWGAFEIGARFSRVDLDDRAFALGFSDPTISANHATAFTVGLNWYLNRALKFQMNYERTNLDHPLTFGGLTTDHEDVFLAAFQVVF